MSEKKRLKPFLKWAGGKRWLSDRLRPLFEPVIGTYREPFLGSGAIYFHNRPDRSVLSDTNQELISCYNAIKYQPKQVFERLKELANLHPDENYYRVRDQKIVDQVSAAARFLYLNRTCWNGLYRVNKSGNFNVPRGTKTQVIFPDEDFDKISESLANAELEVMDFEESIDAAVAGDLVFCDPPYTVAHNLNGFIKYNQTMFSWQDQVRLAAAIRRADDRGAFVVITNADHADLRNLYADLPVMRSLGRSSVIAGASGARKRTTELLIMNARADSRFEEAGL